MNKRSFPYVVRHLLCIFCLAALAGASARADETAGDAAGEMTLTFRGFGTLGVVRTDSDNASFVRDLSQPDGATRRWSSTVDSLVGVQATLRLDDRTEGVIQAISRFTSAITSGPMPSPGRRRSLWVAMVAVSFGCSGKRGGRGCGCARAGRREWQGWASCAGLVPRTRCSA